MAKPQKRSGGYPRGVPRQPPTDGPKPEFNLRFSTLEDRELVRIASGQCDPPESMNVFILKAALERAKAQLPKDSVPTA